VNTRLARPVVVAAVGGALLAGSVLVGAPVYANPGVPTGPIAPKPPAATEQSSITRGAAGPDTSASGLVDLSVPDASIASVRAAEDPGATDPGDTTVPTGSFRLNHTSVWTGQRITVGQGLNEFDDTGDDKSTLTRVVSWGDGTSTALSPTTFEAAKSYSKAGNFKVTVIITDPAGNVSAIPPKTVAVTVPAGKASLSRKSVYQGAPFTVNIGKAPAGATKYRIDWSDGWISEHMATTKSRTGRVLFRYKWDPVKKGYVQVGTGRLSGVRAIKISWLNGKGFSAWQTIGNINLVKDGWKPSLKITKPSSPNRASSWKTVKGTVADKGSGVASVRGTAFRVTSTGKAYCLTANRKWKRYYSDADVAKYCYGQGAKATVVNGKWTFKVPAGLGKNQFFAVEIWAWDYTENLRSTYRTAKITRS
jgi:hypothetical protein